MTRNVSTSTCSSQPITVSFHSVQFARTAASFALMIAMLVAGVVPNVIGQNTDNVSSKAFELRYVTDDADANGVTDFKGNTAVFDTEQRIEYLEKWASYGTEFFQDEQLNQKVFKSEQVDRALEQLKPQPKPEVRTEIRLNDWKYLGFKEGQRKQERASVKQWKKKSGAQVKDGQLHIRNTTVSTSFEQQTWRAHVWWEARAPDDGQSVQFSLSDAVKAGFDESGSIYYVTEGTRKQGPDVEPGEWYNFKVELDLETDGGRYNLLVNEHKIADFVPLSGAEKDGSFYPEAPFGDESSYLTFTDSGEYADVNVSGLDAKQGTVELWFNLHDLGGGGGKTYLFGHVHSRTDWANRIYLLHEAGKGLGLRLGDNDKVGGVFQPKKNRWYHVALSWQNGQYQMYVNGKPVKSGNYQGLNEINQLASLANIGRSDDRSYTPSAHVDELRVWNHARNKQQIQKHLNQRLTGDESGLVGYWPLNEGEGDTLRDASGNSEDATKNGAAWRGQTDVVPKIVDSFSIRADGTAQLNCLRVTSYGPGKSPEGRGRVREVPYYLNTIVDEEFEARPDPEGFETENYDDSGWERVPYPRYAHGGERNAGEHLYLRREVDVDEFERAVLDVETVRPSGDLFVNGEHVTELNRHPARVNVTDELDAGETNVIALRVNPHDAADAGAPRYHMSADTHSSWFAGLTTLQLTRKHHIKDVFARATEIGDPANVRIDVRAGGPGNSFNGKIVARAYPWHPEASDQPAGSTSTNANINGETSVTMDLKVPDPMLWTVDNPCLYKIHVIIQDENGNPVDDSVITTGIRTISQEGGTFRINGEPTMLNGPLIFGHYSPLDHIAQWMFSPPLRKYVEQIQAVKRMNGNVFRMSVHDERINVGIGDRRLARLGDQLGMMFMWQTPSWVRVGSTDSFDFEGLRKHAKDVRNNPSIVLWQPGNHPNPYFGWPNEVVDTITSVDQSRLISPTAKLSGGRLAWVPWQDWPEDAEYDRPWWDHPLVARGTMEQTFGYGADWSNIRRMGSGHGLGGQRMDFLNSDTHAFFDYENEESIGQPNWSLYRGKPYYRIHSYEHGYDDGSLGRKLQFNEWKTSQAWQALTVSAGYRKKRWLGFDGTNWCPLRGGGNTATYMKPAVGYQNHAKLSYHAMRMTYQEVLAGSKNVDIVYGPDDKVPVTVMNLGEEKTVDLTVRIKTIDGNVVAERTVEDLQLAGGRSVTDVGKWDPDLPAGQYYGFEYQIK